jgi:hypothetical protein
MDYLEYQYDGVFRLQAPESGALRCLSMDLLHGSAQMIDKQDILAKNENQFAQ